MISKALGRLTSVALLGAAIRPLHLSGYTHCLHLSLEDVLSISNVLGLSLHLYSITHVTFRDHLQGLELCLHLS